MPVYNHGSGTVQDDYRQSPLNSALNGSSSSGGASLSLDLTKSLVFYVSLTANVTSWTFTGMSALSGSQQVEVHFIQDATGGRTLAGANAAIKLAGGALTLSTGANKRDIVVFRLVNGVLYEVSRSLNL